MSKQPKKVPLNLKLLQKQGLELSSNQQGRITDRKPSIDQNTHTSNQDSEEQDRDLKEEESPFMLKCKQSDLLKFQNSDTVKEQGLTQSTFFPSQKQSYDLGQKPVVILKRNSMNTPKQRYARKYFQQTSYLPTQNINGNQVDSPINRLEDLNAQIQRPFQSQGSLSTFSQKDKNPFQNNFIANVVQNTQVISQKKKQQPVQKYNPAFKLDDEFVKTMNNQLKQQYNGNMGSESVVVTLKSSEILEILRRGRRNQRESSYKEFENIQDYKFDTQYLSENTTNVKAGNRHIHRNFKVISRTSTDLDEKHKYAILNNLYDKFSMKKDFLQTSAASLSELEEKKLLDMYQKNVQNTMTECCQSNNQLNCDYSDSPIGRFNQVDPNFNLQEKKNPYIQLKSEGIIIQRASNYEVHGSQENTQCSTPPQKSDNKDEDRSYSQEKVDLQAEDKLKQPAIVIKSQTTESGTQKQPNNINQKSINQKQYRVNFMDIQNIKNSVKEYSMLFNGGKHQKKLSNPSLKDLDHYQVSDIKNQQPQFRIRKSMRDNEPSQIGGSKQPKNNNELFFCSYQNIEQVTLTEGDQDDFELFHFLSCNFIPDDQTDSNSNLDTAKSDIQLKNFILRKLKGQTDTPLTKNNPVRNTNHFYRTQSQQTKRIVNQQQQNSGTIQN